MDQLRILAEKRFEIWGKAPCGWGMIQDSALLISLNAMTLNRGLLVQLASVTLAPQAQLNAALPAQHDLEFLKSQKLLRWPRGFRTHKSYR